MKTKFSQKKEKTFLNYYGFGSKKKLKKKKKKKHLQQ